MGKVVDRSRWANFWELCPVCGERGLSTIPVTSDGDIIPPHLECGECGYMMDPSNAEPATWGNTMTGLTIVGRGVSGTPLAPGTYLPVFLDGQMTARIACPSCGFKGLLDHEIKSNGDVYPSVVCPGGCPWHKWITLNDWSEEEQP